VPTRPTDGRPGDALLGYTHVPYSAEATVLDLFRAAAREDGDRTAVEHGDYRLSYAELAGKSDDLAGRMHQAGVRHGNLIPLLVADSAALPVAQLAVMSLSAAFVPLDEGWPQPRLAEVLARLDAPVVLATPGQAELARRTGASAVIEVDVRELRTTVAAPDVPGPTCADLAYGFFTSGSTGLPKCALNGHLGLLNRFLTMSRRFRADGAVVLHNSSHAFDSSLWQLLWPLTTGARVVIPVRDGILDLAETTHVIARHGVTMTDFVPSIFNALVALAEADPQVRADLASMRRVLIGGEEISSRAVHRFRQLLPNVRVTNTYGPTECSIGSVFHEVEDGESIPLGRAIDNTAAVVLDDAMRPVPAGTIGEIHIGGDCVGRGYLGEPERSHAAFFPNPFPTLPGEFVYRTGDLGWKDDAGVLHFAGRRDSQVKIGGVRIELAEIEAALTDHTAVRDAKVVVAEGVGRRRLVAFVIIDGALERDELAGHLAERLPTALIPKEVCFLAAFPLTPNGKTDRAALARLTSESFARGQGVAGVAPENDLQHQIAAVWATVLGCSVPGITTSFFDLGGDSLSAQRLALELSRVVGRRVSARDVVARPTVRDQAVLAEGTAPEPVAPPTDLRADRALPDDVRRETDGAWTPGTVLLTGATGFVGVHLLHELLITTDLPVVCLVRAADHAAARHRLERTLQRYGLRESCPAERIVPLVGDLAAPRLGVTTDEYERLASSVHTIVHSAAMVNLLLDYGSHRATNVHGTIELLRLASAGRRKQLHHVSTLGVFDGVDRGDPISETLTPDEHAPPPHGYSQSKWVAEQLVLTARRRGIPSSVYRLGELGPNASTGIPSQRGLVDALLCTAVDLGVSPVTSVVVDYTPVDHIARLVVAAVVRGRIGRTYHPIRPSGFALDELFTAIRQWSASAPVSYERFWEALASTEGSLRLRALLPEPVATAAADPLAAVFADTTTRFLTTEADRLAAEAGIAHAERAAIVERWAAGCIEYVAGWTNPRPSLAMSTPATAVDR
jgi:amino acid adenylation domain-containing protein/thioester reductase-like protein